MGEKQRRRMLDRDLRRRELLDAATSVFAKKGYRRASITDIIAVAGVARGTFYLYFNGKDAVFLAILADFQARLTAMLDDEAAIDAAGAGTGHALLRHDIHRWLQFFDQHRDATAILLKEATSIDPQFEPALAALRRVELDHLARRFRAMQEDGLVRRSLSPEFLSHLHLGMFDQLLSALVLRPGWKVKLDVLADQLADFMWSGVNVIEPRSGR
jgi:AcrR family transcriptional regulator